MRKGITDFLICQILNPYALPRFFTAHHLVHIGENQLALAVSVRRVDQSVSLVKKLLHIQITALCVRFDLKLKCFGNTGICLQIPLFVLCAVSFGRFKHDQMSLTVNDHRVLTVKGKLPMTYPFVQRILYPFSCSQRFGDLFCQTCFFSIDYNHFALLMLHEFHRCTLFLYYYPCRIAVWFRCEPRKPLPCYRQV